MIRFSRPSVSFAFSLTLLIATQPPLGTAHLSVGYSSEKSCFTVRYRGETSAYHITPLFVLPGEKIMLDIVSGNKDARFEADVRPLPETGAGRAQWSWTAPKKTGFYPTVVTELKSGESMALQVFVMVPYEKLRAESINGYRIGRYPKAPPEKGSVYAPPRGFIEVTPANKNALLTPHFKLGQFLCKQEGTYPKYVVLRERLVLKLECLLEHVNKEGIPARTFSVMSGYRTPFYNRNLKNVKFSRHMWGDAADIFITNDPNDNYMADLNGDGKRDSKDAKILFRMVSELQDKPSFQEFVGGLGWYKPTSAHGPFVHVDARGTKAKWGGS